MVSQSDASESKCVQRPVLFSTDPPYYDNIGYADLSDFFYAWLRPALKQVYSKLMGTMQVPKGPELVATPYRFGGDRAKARTFFEEGLGKAFDGMCAAQHPAYPLTVYYAFKQKETDDNGDEDTSSEVQASTGWETMLEGLVKAGFSIHGTWPMRTELPGNLKRGTNALASSIVLVCRPRPADAPVTTRGDFTRALKSELPAALTQLQHGNIAPVDLAQSAIGPGMAIFTRYAKVLESDDSSMTVRAALQLINRVLDEYLSQQEGEYDPYTRFAITWFETHGMADGAYGEAETLATARGVAVSGVQEAGILIARAGKVRLLKREELPQDWNPARDTRLTVWETAQHLIRTLETKGESVAAELVSKLGTNAETARDLAYRLYGICEKKKWADEALAYNGLVIAWSELTRLSAQAARRGPAQMEIKLQGGTDGANQPRAHS
jgi:putative DNA methylase